MSDVSPTAIIIHRRSFTGKRCSLHLNKLEARKWFRHRMQWLCFVNTQWMQNFEFCNLKAWPILINCSLIWPPVPTYILDKFQMFSAYLLSINLFILKSCGFRTQLCLYWGYINDSCGFRTHGFRYLLPLFKA